MNVIFTAIFLASTIALAICSPQSFLTALMQGGKNSVYMAFTLFTVYAVWMGLSKLCEQSGISHGIAKLLMPTAKKIFKTPNEQACESLAMNISCNLLGLGGAATPYAVKAINLLEKENNDYAQKLLFVINATSIQILPSTVIALRTGAGSAAASDIFLPSLICSAVSTLLGIVLFLGGNKFWR